MNALPSLHEIAGLKTALKIVSGGQTGADRAALDWARARRLPHGGWCPQGRLAEDGAIPSHYQLVETPSLAYLQRTEWNVRDSCGTVVFSIARVLTGGSLATVEFARRLQRPWLHLAHEACGKEVAVRLLAFLRENRVQVLNVAGPSAAKEPEVGRFVHETLDLAFFRRGE